jgi:hypothetical protein
MATTRRTRKQARRSGVDVTYVTKGQFSQMLKTQTPSTPGLKKILAAARASNS